MAISQNNLIMVLPFLIHTFHTFPKSGITSLASSQGTKSGTNRLNLKVSLKPVKLRHYAYGNKLGNKLWTRLRLGRSYLNSHGYTIGKVPSPSCQCHHKNETVQNYVLDCLLYTNERQLLFILRGKSECTQFLYHV